MFFCLMDTFKTSLVIKCVGPGLVMAGVTTTLIRILFSYKPTCCIKGKQRNLKKRAQKGRKRHQDGKEEENFEVVENINIREEIRTVSKSVRRLENLS